VRRHHPHGSLDGVHLAPEAVFEVSEAEHDSEHEVRRGLGLDRGATAKTTAQRVELQLRRRAVTGGKTVARRCCSDCPCRSWLILLATDDVRLADELAEGDSE